MDRDESDREGPSGTLRFGREFDEAEALLLASYTIVGAARSDGSPYTLTILERAVKLYDDWGRVEDAEHYRSLLVERNNSE